MRSLLIAVVVFFIAGCSGFNRFGCYESVVKGFPGATIVPLVGTDYCYAVKDTSGNIYYVVCGRLNGTDITVRQLVFRSDKK